MLWKMGWRNIWRNKRRTAITLFSVAFGVWLAITFVGMAHYTYGAMIDSSARMGFGHVTVQPAGYQLTPTLEKKLDDARGIQAEIERLPGVEATSARIFGQAMFAAASRSNGGVFLGVDPAQENDSNNIFVRSMIRGKTLDSTSGRGIVIGDLMAERLGVDIGKKLVYTAIDAEGEIVSEVARVRGIFDTGADSVDGGTALLPIDTVRKALGYGPDAATLISIYATGQREADALTAAVAATVGAADNEVLVWRETQGEIASMIALDRTINYLFQVLLGMLIAAGVLNTMLMSVLERKREFGVMMAVGMPAVSLMGLVMIEALYVAVAGAALGLVITAPWYWFMVNTGIDFSEIYGTDVDTAGVVFEPVIKLALTGHSVGVILSVVFVMAVFAGLYPAFRAGRAVPVESLKAL